VIDFQDSPSAIRGKRANVARPRIQAATVQRINALDAPIHASAADIDSAADARRTKAEIVPFAHLNQREALKNRLLK
jgi:hypothetical protein